MTLGDLEKIISDGLRTFAEVGRALLKIRDGQLYKAEGFKSFEAYCQVRWDLGRVRAYQLVSAASAAENVKKIIQSVPAPSVESQARELARLKEPEKQAAAWEEAVKTAPNGSPTAKHVAEVVAKRLPSKQKKPADASAVKKSADVTSEDVRRAREALAEKPLPRPLFEVAPPDPTQWWTCPRCNGDFNAESAKTKGWTDAGSCSGCAEPGERDSATESQVCPVIVHGAATSRVDAVASEIRSLTVAERIVLWSLTRAAFNEAVGEAPLAHQEAALVAEQAADNHEQAVPLAGASPADGVPVERRLATIERAMGKARRLSEDLDHQLDCVITNVQKVGITRIGGLGGFRVGIELTALEVTMRKLKGLFP